MKKILLMFLVLLIALPTTGQAKVFTTVVTHPNQQANQKQFPDLSKYQYQDWGIQSTNIGKLWRAGYTGSSNIKIAIIDTGIDFTHPDLKVAGGVSFVPYTKSYYDDMGHGTHVAGIIGARNNKLGVKGISYDAKLYAVKAMDRNGYGEVGDLIKGIRWSIDNHMNIINLSLGLSKDEEKLPSFKQLEKVINEAWSKNILIVASAGNDGQNKVSYPANFKNVIAVSATSQWLNEKTGRYGLNIADFSNYGSKIEVSAPGMFVYSTYPMKLDPFWSFYKGYESMDGTSMASPYVVGLLADLKQKYKGENNVQIRNRLHTYARDLGKHGKDIQYGYGMIYVK